MKTEGVKRQGYTMIYNVFEVGVDFDPTDDMIILKCLVGYTLHEGYRVWKIGATYARSIKPAFYYIVSTNKIDAMCKFINLMPWLSFIKSITPLSEEDTENVLGNPAKYMLW